MIHLSTACHGNFVCQTICSFIILAPCMARRETYIQTTSTHTHSPSEPSWACLYYLWRCRFGWYSVFPVSHCLWRCHCLHEHASWSHSKSPTALLDCSSSHWAVEVHIICRLLANWHIHLDDNVQFSLISAWTSETAKGISLTRLSSVIIMGNDGQKFTGTSVHPSPGIMSSKAQTYWTNPQPDPTMRIPHNYVSTRGIQENKFKKLSSSGCQQQ